MLPGWQAFDTHNNSFLAYRPIGKMPRQPLKRPLDGHNLDAGAGHLLAQLRDQKKKKKKKKKSGLFSFVLLRQ
jgi:hypothetical protein